MQRVGKILGMLLLWAVVIGFVVFYHRRSVQHNATQQIESIAVELMDSIPDESLVSSAAVEGWISRSGVKTIGVPVAEVDLVGVEKAVRSDGFVDRASAYVTYDGVLHIEVSQRKPLMRLMVDGYNCYVTPDGFVFPSPGRASVYAPVVTGSYKPPVPTTYVGRVADHINEQLEASEERILELQHQKKPYFDFEKVIKDSVREVAKMRVDKRGIIRYQAWFVESDEEFNKRVIAKRLEKNELYRRYRYWKRENDKKIEAVTALQNLERDKQKKLQKRYEDFLKLINFVKYIEEDSFWRAEIVQIVASTMSSGDLELELIPRTGRHTVLFGKVEEEEQTEEKLDKLLAFYENGLRNLGWDSFRTISIKYKGQVVCTK